MRHPKLLTLAVLAASTAGLGVLAPAAGADTSGATFTLTAANNVTISVPTSTVNLGSAAATAGTLTGSLGTVTVTDARAKLAAAWTVTASSTEFLLAGGDNTKAEQVVAPTAIAYAPGTATQTGPGTGTFVASPLTSMAVAAPVGAWTGVAGSKTVSWSPSLTFALGANQIAGTYNGTITHSLTVAS
ncbi:MAG: hypothetical protein JWN77_1270 [Frankiales bacterium]|jgi:hypothetical protein|nr:hypothetical protein [Frankiales bacterium]